jgi:hypothetical protein
MPRWAEPRGKCTWSEKLRPSFSVIVTVRAVVVREAVRVRRRVRIHGDLVDEPRDHWVGDPFGRGVDPAIAPVDDRRGDEASGAMRRADQVSRMLGSRQRAVLRRREHDACDVCGSTSPAIAALTAASAAAWRGWPSGTSLVTMSRRAEVLRHVLQRIDGMKRGLATRSNVGDVLRTGLLVTDSFEYRRPGLISSPPTQVPVDVCQRYERHGGPGQLVELSFPHGDCV